MPLSAAPQRQLKSALSEQLHDAPPVHVWCGACPAAGANLLDMKPKLGFYINLALATAGRTGTFQNLFQLPLMPLAIEPEEPWATQSAAPPTRTSRLCAHDSVCAPNSAECPTGAACHCRMCAMTAVVAHLRAILPQCKSKLFHRRRRRHTWKPGTAGVPGGPQERLPARQPPSWQ